jgi:L-rhamnose isomerase/sugar isomerase
LLERARLNKNGALDPLNAYRLLQVRENLIKERGANSVASGL